VIRRDRHRCFPTLSTRDFPDPLAEVLRNGARSLLAQAIEAEVSSLVSYHADKLTDNGPWTRAPRPSARARGHHQYRSGRGSLPASASSNGCADRTGESGLTPEHEAIATGSQYCDAASGLQCGSLQLLRNGRPDVRHRSRLGTTSLLGANRGQWPNSAYADRRGAGCRRIGRLAWRSLE
jgi:hypothetical protein